MSGTICTSESSQETSTIDSCARTRFDELRRWWQWLQAGRAKDHCDIVASQADAPHRRVLLISYQFPPTGGSGVQRPAKLAKYLPDCGWSVEVLAAGHSRFCWTDASLLHDLPAEVLTHRVAGWEPACLARRIASICSIITGTDAREINSGIDRQGRWSSRRIEDALFWRLTGLAERIGLDGGESLWIGAASRAAIARHRVTPFDAVISTGPPHVTHCVALRVACATGVPWLADIRDPLVSDFERQQFSTRHVCRMRRLEQDILDCANVIVTTCPSLARDLRDRYPRRADVICAITNGFDRDDICLAVNPRELAERKAARTNVAASGESCVFVAAGAFYGRRELARIVDPLQQVLNEHPSWRNRVQLVIAGTVDAEQRARFERDKPAWVSLAGYLDHAESIRLTASAACNIVMVPDCEHSRLSVPGKTFELLALPTHVLALTPLTSDAAKIIHSAGNGTVVPMEDGPQVAVAMQRIIESHWAGRLVGGRDWRMVDAFDRRTIADSFANCLRAICGSHQPNLEPTAEVV